VFVRQTLKLVISTKLDNTCHFKVAVNEVHNYVNSVLNQRFFLALNKLSKLIHKPINSLLTIENWKPCIRARALTVMSKDQDTLLEVSSSDLLEEFKINNLLILLRINFVKFVDHIFDAK